MRYIVGLYEDVIFSKRVIGEGAMRPRWGKGCPTYFLFEMLGVIENALFCARRSRKVRLGPFLEAKIYTDLSKLCGLSKRFERLKERLGIYFGLRRLTPS